MIDRFLAGLAALLLTLFAFAAGARAGEPAPLILGKAAEQSLTGHYTLLLDKSGAMDLTAVQRAAAAGRFQTPASPATSLGYIEGACWVRVLLHNANPTPDRRWLQQHNSMQHDSTLFLVHGDGRIQRMDNGLRVAIAARDLPMRQILFPVQLGKGETATAYLRLASSDITDTGLTLWQSAAYVDANLRNVALKYLALGATLIVIVFGLLAWEALRRSGLLFGVLAAVMTIFLIFILDGLALDWLPLSPQQWSYLHHLIIFLILACDIAFINAFLDLPTHFPLLARLLRQLATIAVVLAVLFTPHVANMRLLDYAGLFIVTLLMLVAVYAAWRGIPFARLYLLAWGFVLVSVLASAMIDFGLLPGVPGIPDLIMAGYVACALTLSLALYLEIRKVRTDSEAAQLRFLQHQLNEKQRLVDAVEARTRELQEAKSLAEAASSAKTTFLSEVSHELRAPLHTMLGYAQLLARQANGDTAAKLGIISNSGAQLVRLIDDVLAYSRGEVNNIELDLEAMSLPALVTQLEQSARLQAEKRGNSLLVALAPGLPGCVLADEQRLTQVLLNLISNACKFTQDGSIRFSVTAEPLPAGARTDMARLRFTVEDSGIGIAQEDQERVFAPFSRIRNSQRQPGMGLGLAIARQLVRAMGGDIALDSTPQKGSRFSFSLDLQTTRMDASPAQDQEGQHIGGYAGRRRTLLIVDDLADNRAILQHLCEQWGFATLAAEDGYEAIALCRATTAPVDAVLVDQFMPGADGWTFLRAIRETPKLKQLPVILVSAAPATRPDDFPDDMDFDGMLLKPVRTATLAKILEQHLGLEWTRQEHTALAEQGLSCGKLDPADRMELREALALGKVLNLQRKAAALAASNPECDAFAQEIIRLCGMVDLPGLQRLFAQALPDAEEPAGR